MPPLPCTAGFSRPATCAAWIGRRQDRLLSRRSSFVCAATIEGSLRQRDQFLKPDIRRRTADLHANLIGLHIPRALLNTPVSQVTRLQREPHGCFLAWFKP